MKRTKRKNIRFTKAEWDTVCRKAERLKMKPATFIRNLGDRAMAIHFKDVKPNPDNSVEMAEIGEGSLCWDEIIAACEEAGSKWVLVEQDICKRSPFESLKMSYDYLTAKGFC